MSLKVQISDEIKVAMKAKDTLKLSTLRVLKSEIERAEQSSNGKIDLADSDILKIIKKTVEGVKETTQNQAELDILEAYLPQQLSEDAISVMIKGMKMNGTTAMGDIMKYFKTNFDGLYDGKLVSQLAKEIL